MLWSSYSNILIFAEVCKASRSYSCERFSTIPYKKNRTLLLTGKWSSFYRYGAPSGARTLGTLIKSQVLYQLS